MSADKSWPEEKLGNLCRILIGRTPSRDNSSYWNGNHTWLSISDMNGMRLVSKSREGITDLAVTESGCRLVPAGTVLLSFKLSIGKLAVAGVPLYTNEAIAALPIIDQRKLDRDYLYWALGNVNLVRGSDRAAKGMTLNKAKLEEVLIPVPPLNEQRRIAAILDKADTIRRKRQQALGESEELEQALFLSVVGPNAEGYGNWQAVTFEDLAKSGKGAMRTGPFGSDLRHSEFVDEGVAVLGIDNAVQNRFAWGERRFITPEKYEKLTRYTVFPGDVIVTIMGTTGRSAVVPDDIPLSITTKHLATITADRTKAEPEFLSNALHRHPAVLSQIKKANKGAIMDGLNLGIIKSLQIPLPPIEVQRQYVADLGRIRALQAKMQKDRLEAGSLFASLSQRAFNGEL